MKQLKDKIRNKLNNKGFSLTELLASILIMMLATGVLTSTITLASNHYEEQTLKSKADILCNSLSYVIRDRFSNVYKYEEKGGRNYYYSTSLDLHNYPFTVKNIDGTLYFYYDFPPGSYTTQNDMNGYFPLVTDESYSKGALVAEAEIVGIRDDDSENIKYFTVIVTIKKSLNDKDYLSQSNFIVYPFYGDVIYMGL